MADLDPKVVEIVNNPSRVGILATVGGDGKPNMAYLGSPRLNDQGQLVMGLGSNRTLANLEQNPNAVFLALEGAPVSFKTPGVRLYLKAVDVQRQGPVLDMVRKAIAAGAGEAAAKMITAGAVFEITGVRNLVDMG